LTVEFLGIGKAWLRSLRWLGLIFDGFNLIPEGLNCGREFISEFLERVHFKRNKSRLVDEKGLEKEGNVSLNLGSES